MRASEWLDRYNEEQRREGLLELFELRLGRPLSDTGLTTFDMCLETEGHRRLARVVLEHDADGLTRWLAEHAG